MLPLSEGQWIPCATAYPLSKLILTQKVAAKAKYLKNFDLNIVEIFFIFNIDTSLKIMLYFPYSPRVFLQFKPIAGRKVGTKQPGGYHACQLVHARPCPGGAQLHKVNNVLHGRWQHNSADCLQESGDSRRRSRGDRDVDHKLRVFLCRRNRAVLQHWIIFFHRPSLAVAAGAMSAGLTPFAAIHLLNRNKFI